MLSHIVFAEAFKIHKTGNFIKTSCLVKLMLVHVVESDTHGSFKEVVKMLNNARLVCDSGTWFLA